MCILQGRIALEVRVPGSWASLVCGDAWQVRAGGAEGLRAVQRPTCSAVRRAVRARLNAARWVTRPEPENAKGRANAWKGKGKGKGAGALDEADTNAEGAENEVDTGGLDLASLDPNALQKHTVDGYLKLNYDAGAAITAFPKEFGEGGASKGTEFITASGQ